MARAALKPMARAALLVMGCMLGLVEGFLFPAVSFRQQPALRQRSRSARRDVVQLAASAGESDKDDKDKGAADMSSALLASLRARQQSLKKEEEKLQKNWRKGTCVSRAGLFLDDWVRRVSLDWPLVAVGGAGGGVYVADINTGEVLAEAKDAHPAYIETMEAEMEMRLLHGDYDGGGVTALAFSLSQNLLVSGGRDGKVLVWQFDMDKKNLELKATLPCGNKALSAIAVSACGEMIWTGGLDQKLRRWQRAAAQPASAEYEYRCSATHDLGSPVLCVTLDSAKARVVVGTADGHALALHIDAESSLPLADRAPASVIHRWRPHVAARTRSLAVCPDSIVTGGSDGSMVLLQLSTDGDFSASMPEKPLLPNHNGQVVAVLPIGRELLVTGAQDGTIRIWDLAHSDKDKEGASIRERMRDTPAASSAAKCLYGLAGYKVWLGSINTDGQRLVSDGADNKIVVHDFTPTTARGGTDADQEEQQDK